MHSPAETIETAYGATRLAAEEHFRADGITGEVYWGIYREGTGGASTFFADLPEGQYDDLGLPNDSQTAEVSRMNVKGGMRK